MPRPFWRGAVTFGMVTIPIRLYLATESKDVSFHLLHRRCSNRIKQQRYCPTCDEVVEAKDLVRGYAFTDDQHIIVEDADLESIPVASTRSIAINEFVQLSDIDPLYYERSYYVEPEPVAARSYALLMHALQETNRVALAKVALRQKEQLCCLRPQGKGLVMETMYYPDEVRSAAELALPGDDVQPTPVELQMARTLVEMLAAPFQPQNYRDGYREALLEIIERKAQGAALTRPQAAPAKITDLMEALKASLEAAKKERGAPAAAGVPARGPRRARKAS